MYRIEPDGAILKAADPRAPAPVLLEAWACRTVRERDVPAPEILVEDPTADLLPTPFVVYAAVPGVPLSEIEADEEELAALLEEAGRLLGRIHGVQVDGYGRPDEDRYREEGRVEGRSPAFLEEELDRILPYLEHHGLLDGSLSGIRRALPAYRGPALLLHGDWDPAHLYVRGGRITGVIDFGGLRAGDPAWDLARFPPGPGQGDLGALLRGYRPRDDVRTRIPPYRALRALSSARWCHERGLAGELAAHLETAREALRA